MFKAANIIISSNFFIFSFRFLGRTVVLAFRDLSSLTTHFQPHFAMVDHPRFDNEDYRRQIRQ